MGRDTPTRYGRTVTRAVRPARIGRIPIRDFRPLQPEARWPAKAIVGEVVPFSATVFREGHGLLFVELVLTDPTGAETRHRMRELAPGLDRWGVDAQLDLPGSWQYQVHAASDDWAS